MSYKQWTYPLKVTKKSLCSKGTRTQDQRCVFQTMTEMREEMRFPQCVMSIKRMLCHEREGKTVYSDQNHKMPLI